MITQLENLHDTIIEYCNYLYLVQVDDDANISFTDMYDGQKLKDRDICFKLLKHTIHEIYKLSLNNDGMMQYK